MLQEFSAAGPEPSGSGKPTRGQYDQLWQLSMADPHTGLANQLLLVDRLTQALARRRRHGGEVVACHIDLDNLAEINLDLGYTTGNTVLCEVAGRLTSVLRAEDTIGRVGGSELVVVVTVTDEHVVGPPPAQAAAHPRRACDRGWPGDPAAFIPGCRRGRGFGVRRGRAGPSQPFHPGQPALSPPAPCLAEPALCLAPGFPKARRGVTRPDREYRLYTKQEYRPYWRNPIPAKL